MDIRFKLRGGDNEGLFLTINDYKTDKQLMNKKLTNLFDQDIYMNTGVAWSSRQYKLEKYMDEKSTYIYPDRICQNLQWSIIGANKYHAYFFEYRIVFLRH